jgi:small subunit ribosomal protein S4
MAVSRVPVYKRCDYLNINPLVLGYASAPSKRRKNVRKKKTSEYGEQLKEKQKLKFIYGVLERQFRLIYKRAEALSGVTGSNLLQLLELRFDNVVFRLAFAQTRAQSRQWINHGHFTLNGKRVDIPSVTLKVGDVIGINEKFLSKIRELKFRQNRALVSWLSFDEETFSAKVVALPKREEIDFDVRESSIVELYSK